MSEKIYGWLLRLYPRAFREEYGAASRQLFRDRWNAEDGWFARARLWRDVLGDLAVSLPREYRRPPHPKPVTGYRLSEEAVAAMPKHSPLAVYVALPAALAMGWFGGAPHLLLLTGYLLIGLLFTFVHVRRRVGARRHLLNLELFLKPDQIERKQRGFDLTLQRSEITRIFEAPGGSGLIVSGPDRKIIWVPGRLNGYQQVRDHLAAWMPIESEEPTHHSPRLKPRYARTFLFPAYFSALLVRSPAWSVALALLVAPGLLVMVRAALRPPTGVRFKLPPVVIVFGLMAALVVKNVVVFYKR